MAKRSEVKKRKIKIKKIKVLLLVVQGVALARLAGIPVGAAAGGLHF